MVSFFIFASMKIRNTFIFYFILFFLISSCSYLQNKIFSIKIESPKYNLLQKKISFQTNSKTNSFITYWIKNSDSIQSSSLSKDNLIHNISLLFLSPEKEYQFLIHGSKNNSSFVSDTLSFTTESLPESIPTFTLEKDEDFSFDGFIFLRTQMNPGIQLLIDDQAKVVWYQKSDTSLSRPYDLSTSNTYLSLYSPNLIYEINFDGDTLFKIDTKDNVLHHELTKDNYNNIVALSYKYKIVDLTAYGGLANDSIKGDGIVVYDSLGNLLWEWNIFDHEDPLSAYEDRKMTLKRVEKSESDASRIRKKKHDLLMTKDDWSHGNAIGISSDNNYIVSFRSFDQLWKIDSQTGEILWKLGLNGEIPMDPEAYFYQQHAIHKIKGDTLLLFDNGHRIYRMTSRALIFSMIEDKFSLIKAVNLPRKLYSFKQGSVYLMDQNKLLFTSSVNSKILITDMNGNILWNLSSDHSFYRSYYLDTKK